MPSSSSNLILMFALSRLAFIRNHLWKIGQCHISSSTAAAHSSIDDIDLAPYFQKAVTSNVCSHLASDGYAVIDSVLPLDLCHELRKEVLQLHANKAMHPNHTHLVGRDGSTCVVAKHSIFEAEITMDRAIQASAPKCSLFQSDASLRVLLSLHLPFLSLGSSATKLQVNTGSGGCFPLHLDSDEALDGRRVTSIFYLNPTSYAKGGQLRLYPWPRSAPVDIEPVNNRLVLFSSTRMLHRVLPFTCNKGDEEGLRVCFTVWLSAMLRRSGLGRSRGVGPQSQSPQKVLSSPGASREDTIKALLHPDIRQHVLRLVYQDDWRESIIESHPDGEGRAKAVEAFDLSSLKVKSALSAHMELIKVVTKGGYQGDFQWFPR